MSALLALHAVAFARSDRCVRGLSAFRINYNYAGPGLACARHVVIMRAALAGRRAIVALGRPDARNRRIFRSLIIQSSNNVGMNNKPGVYGREVGNT